MLACFTLMALSAVVYLFPIITLDIWYAAILFVMRLSLTCAFAAVFYGTNALFREDLVAIIFAICNMVARLATMGAPHVSKLKDTTVMAVFFSLAILGLMCAGFIRESKSPSSSTRSKRKHKKDKKKKKRSRRNDEENYKS